MTVQLNFEIFSTEFGIFFFSNEQWAECGHRITRWSLLQHTPIHCNTYIATHSNTLQHIHRNTLQNTATHALQHTLPGTHCNTLQYTVTAMISRLLKNIGLFCRIQSLLQGSFAKETYVFREPSNSRHHIVSDLLQYTPICIQTLRHNATHCITYIYTCICIHIYMYMYTYIHIYTSEYA